MIKIQFIRHAKTIGNEKRCYIGRTDESISSSGKSEIIHLKNEGVYTSSELIIISPMRRCLQTAQIIFPKEMESDKYIEINDFREMNFGDFEGKNYEQLKEDTDYMYWLSSCGTAPCPKGEDRETFSKRCVSGFFQMKNTVKKISNERSINTISVVVHGGTIMALMEAFTEGDYYDYQCKNGSGYMVSCYETEKSFYFTDIEKIGE